MALIENPGHYVDIGGTVLEPRLVLRQITSGIVGLLSPHIDSSRPISAAAPTFGAEWPAPPAR